MVGDEYIFIGQPTVSSDLKTGEITSQELNSQHRAIQSLLHTQHGQSVQTAETTNHLTALISFIRNFSVKLCMELSDKARLNKFNLEKQRK